MVKATDDFTIKRGDRLPALSAVMTDAAGAAIDLTGATVRFRLADTPGRTPLVDQPAVIVAAPSGQVRYDWAAADTARPPGRYYAEFVATFAGGTRTYPRRGHLMVRIEERTSV
jgi:hypothetical protein